MQRAYQQAGVDELVGIEREIVVVELGAEADGAGGGIDLVVDGEQMAGGDFVQLRAVEGIDGQGGSVQNLRPHLGKIVFGHVEDDGDGLQLRNHDECIRAAGEDGVAGIDQA